MINSKEIEKRDYYDHLFKGPELHVVDATNLTEKNLTILYSILILIGIYVFPLVSSFK